MSIRVAVNLEGHCHQGKNHSKSIVKPTENSMLPFQTTQASETNTIKHSFTE